MFEYCRKPNKKNGTNIGQGNFVDPKVKYKKLGNVMAATQRIEFHRSSRFFSAIVMGSLCIEKVRIEKRRTTS